MLPQAGQVDEPEVHDLRAPLLRQLDDILWCHRTCFLLLAYGVEQFAVECSVERRESAYGAPSNRRLAPLAGPDPDHVVDRDDEDLPVSDPAGLGRGLDRLDYLVALVVRDDDFDLHLGQKVNGVFAAPVQFGVPFLPAETFDLAYGEPLDPHLGQSALHLVKFEGLDDRFDLLHPSSSISEGVRLPSRGVTCPVQTL